MSIGAPSGSPERDLSHSKELITSGKVGFVQIPHGGHINIDDLGDTLRIEAIGLTPDKRFVIVDCSDMNATLGFVADQLAEERNRTFFSGGSSRIHKGHLGQYGSKNVMDKADLDMRNDGQKAEHQRLLTDCRTSIEQLVLF